KIQGHVFRERIKFCEECFVFSRDFVSCHVSIKNTILKHKACNVPQLIRKVLIPLYLVFAKCKVSSWRVTNNKRHTKRVRSVLFSEIKRINNVTFTLAHLLSICVVHKSVEVHGWEGN